jgi:hypothetical protein
MKIPVMAQTTTESALIQCRVRRVALILTIFRDAIAVAIGLTPG